MDYRIAKGVARHQKDGSLVNVCMVSFEHDSEVIDDENLGCALMFAGWGSGYDLLRDGFSTDYIDKEDYDARVKIGSLAWIDSKVIP